MDISDYGDEWCMGYLRGQENALEFFADHLRTKMDSVLTTHDVGEMTELLALLIMEIEGR